MFDKFIDWFLKWSDRIMTTIVTTLIAIEIILFITNILGITHFTYEDFISLLIRCCKYR